MDIAANPVDGGEWSSFNGGCEMEESEFMAQFFTNCLLPNEGDGSFGFGVAPTRWIGHESMTTAAGLHGSSFDSSDTCHSELTHFYSEGNYSESFSAPYPTLLQESSCFSHHANHVRAADSSTMAPPFDFFSHNAEAAAADQGFSGTGMAEEGCLYQEISNRYLQASGAYLTEPRIADKHLLLKSDSQAFALDPPAVEDRSSDSSNASKKRPRASNAKGKRNQKSGSCSSGDDSNDCQDTSGGATSCLSSPENKNLSSKGKKRAAQGSATDPQSLYARKRRERINERLRILQNLIPNGTKVDISTMLEEAVQYVKFLQHQIKMLSSDDLWMYAAIAYNGMNLGSDLKLNAPAN